jgi:type I restriction-modification system DNA methylase subunit
MGTLFQQYYTKSNEIVGYMMNNLSLKPNTSVLEPCAGDGVFVNALLQAGKNISIDIFELDEKEAQKLKILFEGERISVKNTDTLLYKDFINGSCNNKYDFIIANPPYGAWQDYEKREKLKIMYPGLYVKETYSTFLFLCLNLLKPGGRLVFITPDTYLNLHMHTYLRKFILQNALIKEIAIFPSSFFPGVNFGYSKLSIITLEKTDSNMTLYNNTIKILDNFKEPSALITRENIRVTMLKQEDVLKNADCAFIYSGNQHFDRLVKYASVRIGDIADCVTGIYTGDDKKYIKVKDYTVKNGKNYQIISNDEIHRSMPDRDLNGFNGIDSYIPIIKGGNTRYLKQNLWYINWSKEAIMYYKTNRKSRFQNSQYYFK